MTESQVTPMAVTPSSRMTALALETRSGLDPWVQSDLPVPPAPKGFGWFGVIGPGVILLGTSIGSGEFLLGPAVFVKHGLTLLWVTAVAILLQTVFNTEVMRYTLATGEPIPKPTPTPTPAGAYTSPPSTTLSGRFSCWCA